MAHSLFLLAKVLAAKKPAALATLARVPSPAEIQAVQNSLAAAKDEQRLVIEDTLWALLSSRDFCSITSAYRHERASYEAVHAISFTCVLPKIAQRFIAGKCGI